MSATLPGGTVAQPQPRWAGARSRQLVRALSALHLELAAVVGLAGVLDFWRLSQNGWANTFYSAAARSMSSNWHDFLYASFDPSGVMTVDKPPLALWLQSLAAREFGFHPLSILIPQALIGMATVGLAYDLTRRRFGRAAGFVAGLVLALTPMTVALSRHNNPDALLVLSITAALWCTVRGLERGRTAWLVLAGACVGLGFETKFAVALVVVPGIAAAWMWVAPRGRIAAAGQLLQAGAAAIAVGAAWPLLIALTPSAQRPWLGSTSNNSIWSLIAGYNGLGRVDGQAGGPTAATSQAGLFGGAPGPFRLVDPSLGGQVGWLLGFAVVGGAAILVLSRLRPRDPRTGWLIAVGGSFLAAAVVLSSAKGIFHPYYTAVLAPFTAALVGAGAVQIAKAGRPARALAALAVAAAVAIEIVVIHNNPQGLGRLEPLLVVGAIALGALLVAFPSTRVRSVLLAVALAGLLVAPAIWSVDTLGHPTSSTFPAGGPAGADAVGGHTSRPATPVARHTSARRTRRHRHLSAAQRNLLDSRQLRAVLVYVRRHGGGTVGIKSQEQAAPQIIAHGTQVAGLGGFSGAEAEMSVSWFADAVHRGQVRWVLFNGSTRPAPGRRVGATRVLGGVAASCRRIPRSRYVSRRPMAHGALYDCAGHSRALQLYAAGVKSRARLTRLSR